MSESKRRYPVMFVCLAILLLRCARLAAEDAAADEPLIREFSPLRAAEYCDETAGAWVETRRCAACHTIPPYLMARPLLSLKSSAAGKVRGFVERVIVEKLEGEPQLPVDGISAITVQIATALAINDRQSTGKLHPVTRQALDRMWTRQRDDGSWEWPFRDVPPIKIDEHYGVTFAAIGAGTAPDKYAETEAARAGLAKVRRYLKAHPAVTRHQRGMLLWASCVVHDLLNSAQRTVFAEELLAAQRPDGGWSLASLIETGPADSHSADSAPSADTVARQLRDLQAKPGYRTEFLTYAGRSGAHASSLASDGYATGFVIHVVRQGGVPADEPRIVRGITWLKANQRQSGRWFTPSQGDHALNHISNAGTAYAIMALAACGALEEPRARSHLDCSEPVVNSVVPSLGFDRLDDNFRKDAGLSQP